jgi:hypothetical protein
MVEEGEKDDPMIADLLVIRRVGVEIKMTACQVW